VSSPTPRLRQDVPLSSAHTLVLLLDHDGEYVIRVLRQGQPSTYITPKVRLERRELEWLDTPMDRRWASGPLRVEQVGVRINIWVDGVQIAWGGRIRLQGAIRALLAPSKEADRKAAELAARWETDSDDIRWERVSEVGSRRGR